MLKQFSPQARAETEALLAQGRGAIVQMVDVALAECERIHLQRVNILRALRAEMEAISFDSDASAIFRLLEIANGAGITPAVSDAGTQR
jgi:hypothetical protein